MPDTNAPVTPASPLTTSLATAGGLAGELGATLAAAVAGLTGGTITVDADAWGGQATCRDARGARTAELTYERDGAGRLATVSLHLTGGPTVFLHPAALAAEAALAEALEALLAGTPGPEHLAPVTAAGTATIVEELRARAASWTDAADSPDAQLDADAADEIARLRGELENVQRDRAAQLEVAHLRALITEWVDAYADAQWNPIAAAHHRLHAADKALREEANR